MNIAKLFIFGVFLFVLMSANVSAIHMAKVQVHAVDQDGNDLEGVVVAPEFKYPRTGWNDFFPKEKTTDSTGIASSDYWSIFPGALAQANYAYKDGYTCTSGAVTQITTVCGLNTIEVECTSNEIPEFGVLAAGIAIVGALGVFLYKRQ